MYEQAGALWFKSSALGDEKDRVLRKKNGLNTYFATDIAYHMDKLKRDYQLLINIWGSDHHGYIDRMQAALSAVGAKSGLLEVLMVQFVHWYRDGVQVPMSTRSGSFVELKTLQDEIGKDALRFFYVWRSAKQVMNFDLDLAKAKSNENPVFYIQYAHARIVSVLGKSKDKLDINAIDLSLLSAVDEHNLLRDIRRYKATLEKAALSYSPHLLAYYLRDIAHHLHQYYNSCEFLVANTALRQARLLLLRATKQILVNGLTLLGVSAPNSM